MTRLPALPRPSSIFFLSALAVAIGCSDGADAGSLRGERAAAPAPAEAAPAPVPTAEAPAAAFEYAAQVQLLPFDVRLAKVAHVVGVAPEDPLLEPLRARRLDLGDHDYATGHKPDLAWTSTRMGTWVRALKPVCASSTFRTRYPAFPDALDALSRAAYGRGATDEDRQILADTLGKTALDADTQHRLTCLAVLSSLEFVAR